MENFLTHLELQGFKSFASKTDFSFDTRVVGVVGPNGSGKSNIIDAIRWVLGEREAKNLRGDLLENLVFAGTSGKGPASLARVTLRFNNREGVLPVEAQEVSVSRRIDRSGVSQFYINNQEVRLKDLISTLTKARMGSRGFTIIGQGDSQVFVRVSPGERREMIEEILGLKEYRLKKKTAERQLTQSRNNMEQLGASLAEIEPHLKFLRKQKNKWEKRSEIEEEMKELSRKYFGHHYYELKSSLEEVGAEMEALEKERQGKAGKVEEMKKKVEEEKGPEDKLKEVRGELGDLRKRRLELEKESARLEARMEHEEKSEEKSEEYSSSYLLSNIKSFLDEAGSVVGSNDSGKAKEILKRWFNHFQSFFVENKKEGQHWGVGNPNVGESEVKEIEKKIGEVDEEIKKKESEENNILSVREEESRKLRGQIDELEKKKNEERKIEDKIKEKEMTKERSEFHLQELKNKWQSLGFSLENLENLERPSSEEDWDEMELKINRLSSKLSAIGEIDETLIEEARETEERYESMKKELEDLEKASADLSALINDLEKKIYHTFKESFSLINKEFNNYFRLMFGGGKAKLKLAYPKKPGVEEEEPSFAKASENEEEELQAGVEINLNLPKKKATSLEMLSGGEKTLVSIAALFALVSISPPPFLVLDEIDAALDDENARRFSELVKEFSKETQFLIVTHNKITMEAVGTLYGVTMGDDGVSKLLSLKFEDAEEMVSE